MPSATRGSRIVWMIATACESPPPQSARQMSTGVMGTGPIASDATTATSAATTSKIQVRVRIRIPYYRVLSPTTRRRT